MIEIQEATKSQAAEIVRLIMMAMTDDCCLYFCGDGYGLDDFHKMMAMLGIFLPCFAFTVFMLAWFIAR